LERLATLLVVLPMLAGCLAANQPKPTPAPFAAAAPKAAPVEILTSRPARPWEQLPESSSKPFDQVLIDAGHTLLSMIELPLPGEKHLLVIDPPVDGRTGMQTFATRKIAARIAELAREKFSQYALQPFSPASIQLSPLVVLGTLTPVNASGQPEGKREVYRICLAVVDLKSGRLLSRELASARSHGVNHAPTPYFQDSPAWTGERAQDRHASVCETTRPGEQVRQDFTQGLAAEALIQRGIAAYDGGRYKEAFERFSSAAESAAGDRVRIDNGVYLASRRLGQIEEAAAAFSKIIEHELEKKALAINFSFRPGSAGFAPEKSVTGSYPRWLEEIGRQALRRDGCLEIVGHTSRSGSEYLNNKLSLERAEYVKQRLEAQVSGLTGRVMARGAGSRENLVGTGKDDLSDALDRRVGFRVIPCADLGTQTANRY